jgi:hypothetical protein
MRCKEKWGAIGAEKIFFSCERGLLAVLIAKVLGFGDFNQNTGDVYNYTAKLAIVLKLASLAAK